MAEPTLAPGSWFGLLGGGQLGRMFAMAAQALGYRVAVLDPADESPAGAVAESHIAADYTDEAALTELARRCVAVTTEFENVPAQSLSFLERRLRVSPAPEAVAIAQDRAREKHFIAAAGIAVAPHALVLEEQDLEHLPAVLFPGILKATRLGYDGKGQVRVASHSAVREAFRSLGGVPCVLEQHLELAAEVSVVVARDFNGRAVTYPIAHNIHRDGILAITTVPAPGVNARLQSEAEAAALQIAARLDYHGVLCVEFFVLANGKLVVNEIAPRPHNSGHYTIDACVTSQFEQQARILAGLPLGSTRQHSAAIMLNLLGDLWFAADAADAPAGVAREPDWAGVLSVPGTKLHLYGKREARRGRKMGHVCIVAPAGADALAAAREVAQCLGIASW